MEEELEKKKSDNVAQLLFKAARLWNIKAISIIQQESDYKVKLSHTSLLPYIELEGTRITVIADKIGITKQAVSQMVAELEKMGVLYQKADPADKRAKLVCFTERGWGSIFHGLSLLKKMEAELGDKIGKERMAELYNILRDLVKVLEGNDGK